MVVCALLTAPFSWVPTGVIEYSPVTALESAMLNVTPSQDESAFPVAEALIAKGTPFVFATGYGERGLPENYRGRPVLQKPFAKDDLERVLQKLFP